MRKIVAFICVTLDGVMQAPGRPDEDTRGGFVHGGWGVPYADADSARLASEGMQNIGAMLLGRRTYEDLLPAWNERGGPFKDMLNNTPKLVASRTLEEPLPWPNSTVLRGDAVRAVRELRDEDGKDFLILGSGALIRSLLAEGLLDELILLIHPLVLGSGRRLFADDGPGATFALADTRTTSKGLIVGTYRRTEHGPTAPAD
jgi:dihydrofolate reductase